METIENLIKNVQKARYNRYKVEKKTNLMLKNADKLVRDAFIALRHAEDKQQEEGK